MLLRRDHDRFEFEMGNDDTIEHHAGQQLRISLSGTDHESRRIICELYMTPALLARLKGQVDAAASSLTRMGEKQTATEATEKAERLVTAGHDHTDESRWEGEGGVVTGAGRDDAQDRHERRERDI